MTLVLVLVAPSYWDAKDRRAYDTRSPDSVVRRARAHAATVPSATVIVEQVKGVSSLRHALERGPFDIVVIEAHGTPGSLDFGSDFLKVSSFRRLLGPLKLLVVAACDQAAADWTGAAKRVITFPHKLNEGLARAIAMRGADLADEANWATEDAFMAWSDGAARAWHHGSKAQAGWQGWAGATR